MGAGRCVGVCNGRMSLLERRKKMAFRVAVRRVTGDEIEASEGNEA